MDPGGDLRILTEGFTGACEPDVSFDGERILFAGKRAPEDPWNIWEMSAAGGEPRQITRDAGNCRNPVYQATLYTIENKAERLLAQSPLRSGRTKPIPS